MENVAEVSDSSELPVAVDTPLPVEHLEEPRLRIAPSPQPLEIEVAPEVEVVQENHQILPSPVEPAPIIPPKKGNSPTSHRAFPVPSSVPGLVRLLQSTSQIHWFFTGDDLSFPGQSNGSDAIGLAHVRYLQDVVGRTEDTFTVQTSPHFRLQDLQQNFEKTVTAESPQVVVILCGQTELQTRWESTLAFERMFHKLVLKIRNAGAVPIIATPPWPCPTESFYHSDELIRLEAIRACAEESAALLVDHWEHWEHSSTAGWYSGDGHSLSASGIMALVDEFSRTLQLVPEAVRP